MEGMGAAGRDTAAEPMGSRVIVLHASSSADAFLALAPSAGPPHSVHSLNLFSAETEDMRTRATDLRTKT